MFPAPTTRTTVSLQFFFLHVDVVPMYDSCTAKTTACRQTARQSRSIQLRAIPCRQAKRAHTYTQTNHGRLFRDASLGQSEWRGVASPLCRHCTYDVYVCVCLPTPGGEREPGVMVAPSHHPPETLKHGSLRGKAGAGFFSLSRYFWDGMLSLIPYLCL